MAEFQERTKLTDRKYPDHSYTVGIWPKNKKVDLWAAQGANHVTLKMSKREAEELITRLQFAVHELEKDDE